MKGKRDCSVFVLLAGVSAIMNVLPSFVNELDESEARVLLQRVLPFLGAEEHNQLHDGIAILECGQTWQIAETARLNERMTNRVKRQTTRIDIGALRSEPTKPTMS